MPGYELAVHKCLQYTGSVFTDIAYASLSLFDDTALVAEVALDAFVLEGFKKISIHRIFSLPASTGYGPGGLFGTVFKFKWPGFKTRNKGNSDADKGAEKGISEPDAIFQSKR